MSAKSKTTETGKPAPTFNEIMDKAAKSAIRGGTAGAVAMGANVACLMWMRTTVSLVYIYERYFFFQICWISLLIVRLLSFSSLYFFLQCRLITNIAMEPHFRLHSGHYMLTVVFLDSTEEFYLPWYKAHFPDLVTQQPIPVC